MTQAITIFIIDDDRDLLEELRDIFHSHNFGVETFSRGDEALDRMRDRIPDVVLLDMHMRKKSGFSVAREMERRTDTRDVPIVVVSAFYEHDDVVPVMRVNGFKGLMTKPIRPRELLNTVKTILNMNEPNGGGA